MVDDRSVADLWSAFLAARPGLAGPESVYTAWHFCDNQKDADELVELVLSGRKRATTGALWSYEAEGESLPQVGDFSVVTDWAGTARCVIRTSAVEIVAFGAVSAEFAAAEGEGDLSLDYWRRAHEAAFARELAPLGRTVGPDTPVVCERFEVVFGGLPADPAIPADPAVAVSRTEVLELEDRDIAEIHDLRLRAADFFAEVGDPPPTPESFEADLDDLPDGYSRADEVIYRAYRQERLLGYAEVLRGFERADQWIVGIVLVDTAERGVGVGRAIVDAIASDAVGAGMESLAAGVIALRERSLAFWRREGFTREAKRRPITIGAAETVVIRLERPLGASFAD